MGCAAEALHEALKCEAHFRLAEQVYPEAEFVVLRESLLGQVCGADQQSRLPIGEFGKHSFRVQEARAFKNDADFESIGERLHEVCELLKHIRRVEVLPVQREDDRSLSTGLEALAHRGLEQRDAVRGGERRDEHEVLRARDERVPDTRHGRQGSAAAHSRRYPRRKKRMGGPTGIAPNADHVSCYGLPSTPNCPTCREKMQ